MKQDEVEDKRIVEARRLLWEVTQEQKQKRNAEIEAMLCECGHARKNHSVSYSINYTGGMCELCKCKHYLLAN